MARARRYLGELSRRVGILDGYVDISGKRVVPTSDVAREALLSVMGMDAPTEDAARGWLAELTHEARSELVAPVRVVARDDRSARGVPVQLPPGLHEADVEITLTEEAGHTWRSSARVRRRAVIGFPTRVPYGYHHVVAIARHGLTELRAEQSLIVVPSRCVTPDMLFRGGRMGIVANLYATKREHDWGVGDLTTLMLLVEWAGARGASFVGVNPLHALYNRGMDISPYSPVTRLFRNPLYIDVEVVPELQHSDAARALLAADATRHEIAQLRAAPMVGYDRAIDLKMRVLTALHETFRSRAGTTGASRARDYLDFVRLREPELTRFATWMAIAESAGVPDWRQWPAPMQRPDDDAVAAFRDANAARVDLHRWLQYELHRQLGEVATRARTLGMEIGVYQDLAIGTSGGGSDTWTFPELFLRGASVGAPPDPYSALGQNWGLPPMDPRALRQQSYRYWIQLLRRGFEHAGALRIDHVMGLFRSFWIPDGATGRDGAYMRFPAGDLLGILALESVRHDALVVGEDLGVVPKEVPPALRKWGILSSKVLYFERDRRGFRPAKRYPPLSLATANTHDMAPIAGFWSGRDIDLRKQVGLVADAKDVKRAREERAVDKKSLLRLLGIAALPSFDTGHFVRTLTGAVHEFLCSSPAKLVGLSFDDLIAEQEPVNVPGVGPDKYPIWRRRTRMTVEEAGWSFEVDDTIRCASRRGPARR
ncbi:MAG TPA: 4-alpha-glucanotransferase [Gemmatimonadaceae bacterium]|nr:4-alpha-glucanotransferase [Gemmatimonadaceae bacterium]